jgi:hypothetical protein
MLSIFLSLLSISYSLAADGTSPLTAAEIMLRFAENQDREQAERNQFIYQQVIHRTARHKNGNLIKEEFWTYTVIPNAKGTEKKLISVKGRYLKSGKYLFFEGQPVPDAGLLNVVFDDDDKSSRDGVDSDLFPLTGEKQKQYTFECVGQRIIKGRTAYQIRFRPIDRHDYGWTGEALIDQEEFQPVQIYTQLSRKLPVAVRAMLGTDVHGLGFNLEYTRVNKDIWFPASYGTEFGVHALFFINRTFTESTKNTNFRRATVDTRIEYSNNSQP